MFMDYENFLIKNERETQIQTIRIFSRDIRTKFKMEKSVREWIELTNQESIKMFREKEINK